MRGQRNFIIAMSLLVAMGAASAFGQASEFAVRFYGTGVNQQDRVRIAIDDDAPGPDASAVCDVGAGSFTLDFWLRGTLADNSTPNGGGDVESFDFSWIDGNIIIDRDIWGDSEADWGISLAGGFVRFGTGPGDPPGANTHNTIEGNVNVLDGAWHHVAVVRDVSSGTNSIYVDGILDFAGSPGVSTDDISYPNDGTPNPVTPWGPYIVIGAEKLSTIIDWQDRNTCVLFGDGAGAAILQNRPNAHGLLTTCIGADGNKAGLLSMPGGGSQCPATVESVNRRLHYLRMDGKETFKNAVMAMHTAAREALRRCEIDITAIKCVIPHQANQRIIDAVGERLETTPEQLFVNLHKYGNTSAASVAIALDEAVSSGRIQRGDLILMVVFGAGLTWGAAVIEW